MADDIFTHEIWKEIPGLEHEASSLGRIRRNVDGQIMRASECHGPYSRVWIRCEQDMLDVHVLVALAFHGPRPEKFEIDHKDQNTRNNEPDNLEYVPHLENMRRAKRVHGNNHPNRVLSEADVEAIRQSDASLTELCREFNASKSAIHAARKGKTWRRVSVPTQPAMRSGEHHFNARLTEAAVKVIRETHASLKTLSRQFDVCKSVVANARYGKTWKEVKATPKEPKQGRAVLTDDLVIQARALWGEGRMGMNEIRHHLDLKISWSCLYSALKGKTFKHLNQIAPLSTTDHRSRVPDDLTKEIRTLLEQGATVHEVRERYGLCLGTIYSICNGRGRWQYLGPLPRAVKSSGRKN